MPYESLREFIQRLEQAGRLRRVSVPVDPHLEMTEIQTRLLAEQGPAILFEQPVKRDGTRYLKLTLGDGSDVCAVAEPEEAVAQHADRPIVNSPAVVSCGIDPEDAGRHRVVDGPVDRTVSIAVAAPLERAAEQDHATSVPDTAWPINGTPARLIPGSHWSPRF